MGEIWKSNFVVTFDDGDSAAEARAKAVAGSCETDLKWLEAIFKCQFGSNNYATIVDVMPPGTGGASNEGWDPDRSSHIWMDPTFDPTPAPTNVEYIRDELARFLFVAEMAEILMDFTGYGWDRGGSNGEALSIVLATELHPDGYYLSRQGPRVQNWLNRFPTEDWVTNTKPADHEHPEDSGDQDFVAFGCGIAYINFLRYQLGKSLSSIVCQPDCTTLAQTFDALTGEGAGWAFVGFERMVRTVFPHGGRDDMRDNFFPLLDRPKRTVSAQCTRDTEISSVRRPLKVSGTTPTATTKTRAKGFLGQRVTLRPGPLCPEKAYPYDLFDTVRELEFLAFCHGFGQASVRWEVNGVPLPTQMKWDTAVVPATLTLPVPHRPPTPIAGAGTTRIAYAIVPAWNTSQLLIRNAETVGNCDITVTATAAETERSDGDTAADASWILQEVDAELDSSYTEDARRCNPTYIDLGGTLAHLSERIRLMLVAPDPSPEEAVAQVLAVSQRLQRGIDAVAETSGIPAEALVRELSTPSNVRALAALSAKAPAVQRVKAPAMGRARVAAREAHEAVGREAGAANVDEPVG
jgi:hypothetical protein